MAELGLMGVAVPAEYGGAGMDNVSYALRHGGDLRGCASCGVILSVNNSLVCDPISSSGAKRQKRRWLPDLSAGKQLGSFASRSRAPARRAAQKATAVKDGGDWILNGCKNFITNGAEATSVSSLHGGQAKGVKGITPISCRPMQGVFGRQEREEARHQGLSTSQINLDDVRVGADGLLAGEGQGFKVAMSTLDGGRIGIAAQALGIARKRPKRRAPTPWIARPLGSRLATCRPSVHARRHGDRARRRALAHLARRVLKDHGQRFTTGRRWPSSTPAR